MPPEEIRRNTASGDRQGANKTALSKVRKLSPSGVWLVHVHSPGDTGVLRRYIMQVAEPGFQGSFYSSSMREPESAQLSPHEAGAQPSITTSSLRGARSAIHMFSSSRPSITREAERDKWHAAILKSLNWCFLSGPALTRIRSVLKHPEPALQLL